MASDLDQLEISPLAFKIWLALRECRWQDVRVIARAYQLRELERVMNDRIRAEDAVLKQLEIWHVAPD
jgi:hypothetical protein